MTKPQHVSRRAFVGQCTACGACALMGAAAPAAAQWWRKQPAPGSDLKEAYYWESAGSGRVRCLTCPNECLRGEGEVTACHTRVNREGKMYTLTYGKPCVVFQDPLEKNPLYHVAPGNEAIGVGTAGCNLICTYCQNWTFSQVGPDKTRNMDLMPADLVKRAQSRKLKWITFSYTEPVAYYEYAIDTAKLARKAGLKVAVVTAGYIKAKPLEDLMDVADAFSVTLKGYSEAFYKEVCGCPLKDVWTSIKAIAAKKKWLEIVNLIVPGMNDDMKGIKAIADAIARLNKDIPLHFLRFAPAYKLKHLAPTPIQTLEQARETALGQGLRYVYLANLPGHDAANTFCPGCKQKIVERVGFRVLKSHLRNGRCPHCSRAIPGMEL